MKKKILNVINFSIDQVNKDLSINIKIDKNENSVIFNNSNIDSLAFVNFIMSIEKNISKEFDISFDLANEELLMEKLSPFRTVNALVDYIHMLVKNHNNEDRDDGQK